MFRKAIIALGVLGGLIALLLWWRRLTQAPTPAGHAAYPTYWQPPASEPARPPAPPAGEIAGGASHAAAETAKTLLAGSSEAEGAAASTASAVTSAAFDADQNAAANLSVAAAGDAAAEQLAATGAAEQAGAAQAAAPGEYAGPSTIDALFAGEADNADAGAAQAVTGGTSAESADAAPAGDTEGLAPADSVDQAEARAAEDTGNAAPADDTEDQAETNAPPADDLIVIEGIGPKISTIVAAAGINSFAQLADTSVEKLAEILRDAKLPTANPSTWPDQARLAAEGKFDELKELQDRIRNGKLEP